MGISGSTSSRVVAGVSGGLGRYFDLNPALYRIAFTALAFAGGTGVLLYAAAWLVIPEEGQPDSIAAAELRKHRDHPNRLLGLALLAAIGLAVLSSVHLWPSPGNFWVVAALLVAAFAWWRGRIVLGLLAAGALIIVAGLVFAVRVPVFVGHSESVNIEIENEISAQEAREILREAPGVLVIDKHEDGGYATPLDCVGEFATFVSRIREDHTIDNGLSLWVVSDNLRKGAALNAVQIAELMLNRGLFKRLAAA